MSETPSAAGEIAVEPANGTRRKVLLGGLAGLGGLGLGLARTEPAHAVTTDELDVRLRVLEQPWAPSSENFTEHATLPGQSQIQVKTPMSLGLGGITNVVVGLDTDRCEIRKVDGLAGAGKQLNLVTPFHHSHYAGERVLVTHHGAALAPWWGVKGTNHDHGAKLNLAIKSCWNEGEFHAADVHLPKGHVGTTKQIDMPHEMALLGEGPNYTGTRISALTGFQSPGPDGAVIRCLAANNATPIPWTALRADLSRVYLRRFLVDCNGLPGVCGIIGAPQQQAEWSELKVEDCHGEYAICLHDGQHAKLRNLMVVRSKLALDIKGCDFVYLDNFNAEDGIGTEDIFVHKGAADQFPWSVSLRDLHFEPRGTTMPVCVRIKDARGITIDHMHVSGPDRPFACVKTTGRSRVRGELVHLTGSGRADLVMVQDGTEAVPRPTDGYVRRRELGAVGT